MLQHLRAFSEYDSPSKPIITPLIRVDMWYPKHMGHWGSLRLMKDRLADQIRKLEQAPVGDRAIMLWWLLTHELYTAKGADPVAIYEKGVVPTARAMAMLKPFSDEIKKRGITLDLIFIDNEGGFGAFDMGIRWVRKVMRSPRARAKMPREVAALNPDHLDQRSPHFPVARTIWDRYAYKLKYDALKRVVTHSRYFEVRPSRSATPVSPSAVNFWSVNPAWPIYDYNGWFLENTSLDGRSSGPQCYIGTGGSAYARRVHHRLWNDFINLLNNVRSCLGKPGSVAHPVLPHPGYCHPWIQEQFIAHNVRAGINWSQNRCAFIYWNAHGQNTNDPIMAAALQRHDLAYPLRRDLPEIPFDVDEVTTGDYTTTYADFLTNMESVLNR